MAQLCSVIFHNHRHLFPVDVGVRCKGGGGNAFHNTGLRRPVHIGGIVGVGFHIGEFPGLVTVRVDARQPPQSCHKHSSGHAGARAKGGVAGAGEQSPAGCKEDVICCPVAGNVGKGRGRVLVAHAVNAEMTGFKNHRFQAGIVAGFGDPFHLASVIYIDCIEITCLLTLCRCVGQTHRYSVTI